MRELKFVIPEQNLADIKLFLINFECYSRAVDTPYTSDILEQCILVKDMIDVTCDTVKVQCKLCSRRSKKR